MRNGQTTLWRHSKGVQTSKPAMCGLSKMLQGIDEFAVHQGLIATAIAG